jgi:TonB family protein
MSFVRLKMFLIISLALHIIALFIVAAFFHFEGTVTRPQLVGVGVISEYRDPRIEGGSPLESSITGGKNLGESIPLDERSSLERSVESHSKKAPKPENKIVKGVTNEQLQLREILKKKAVFNRANEFIGEKGTTQLNQNNGEGERTNEIASNTTAGNGSSTGAGFSEGISVGGSGFSAKGSGQGEEQAGYPDYKINPKPKYPMIARRSGYEGVVLLRVFVMESGKVEKIELEKSSGYEVLDKSAIEAVKDWIFIPGKKNGVSISSWVTVPIKFELNKG